MKELTNDEKKEINGGTFDPLGVASLGVAILWCCYELGGACAAYDKRHQ